MKLNSESIYGCVPATYEKPQWGYYTEKGDVIYAHFLQQGIGQYYLPKMKGKIKSANLLMDGSEVFVGGFWLGNKNKPFVGKADSFLNFGKPLAYSFPFPDKIDTVVKLKMK